MFSSMFVKTNMFVKTQHKIAARNLSDFESTCHPSITLGGGFILSLLITERQTGKL